VADGPAASIYRVSLQLFMNTCINWMENQQPARITPKPNVFPSTLAPNLRFFRRFTSGFTGRATAGGEVGVACEACSGARNNKRL
jgi:hypothetical protein